MEPTGLIFEKAETASYRFEEWGDKARIYFDNHGYVVIKNILSTNQLKQGRKLLWEFLSKNGWNEYDYQTWNFGLNEGEPTKGLYRGHGVSQCKLQWFIRKNKKVLNIFSKIWNVKYNELLCSYSSMAIFRPWYLNNTEQWKTIKNWYHIDQNVLQKPNIECVQGYVTLFDQNEKTGSTVIIPNTHLLTTHNIHLRKHANMDIDHTDFVIIPKNNDLLKLDKILICTKAGDIILWDSRTIHCNSPALLTKHEMRNIYSPNYDEKEDLKEYNSLNILNTLIHTFDINSNKDKPQNKPVDLLRVAVLVCMLPTNKASKNVRIQRINAYINQYTLSHWPNKVTVLQRPDLDQFPFHLKQNEINQLDEMEKNLTGITDQLLKDCKEYDGFYY